MSKAAAVSGAEFEESVLQADVPVLVDFWAEWCGPCRRVAPELDAVAEQYDGKLKIVKLNVDEEPELAGKYGIQSIPAMLLFKEGKEVDRLVGAMPRAMIAAKVEPHLS